MFYYVAKIGWLIAKPSNLLVIVMLAGLVALGRGRARTGRRLVLAAVLLAAIGGLSPLGNALILPLENRFRHEGPPLEPERIAGIIVLGGAEEARVGVGRGQPALNEAAERVTEAIALARRFPEAPVVFTGGSAVWVGRGPTGAEAVGMAFRRMGLAPERIRLEDRARNTWENAVFTKALVGPEPGEVWLLVTSAFHMPRAVGVFRRVGFPVLPWPVDYRTAGAGDLLRLNDSVSEGLRRLDFVTKEWLGLFVYWITGRIDDVLPGPGGS